MTPPNRTHAVVIVGTGFAGIGMAIALKQAGVRNFVILEKADRVGGTWRENTYPGCACDIRSHLYSFSFEPKSDWTREFAPQPEILGYIEHCVAKYGLAPHIKAAERFGRGHIAKHVQDPELRRKLTPTYTLGTGFHVTDALAKACLIGRNGLKITDAWRDGVTAHLGTAVTGFPNLFFLVGPNTGLGHLRMRRVRPSDFTLETLEGAAS